MKILSMIGLLVVIGLGVFMFFYGGYDDSPGAQLLGVVTVIGGVVGIVKSRKKKQTE